LAILLQAAHVLAALPWQPLLHLVASAFQVANFEFFLAAGTQHPPRHTDMHWAIVVSGENCSPCQGLYGILR
jgi:hypothetical protein